MRGGPPWGDGVCAESVERLVEKACRPQRLLPCRCLPAAGACGCLRPTLRARRLHRLAYCGLQPRPASPRARASTVADSSSCFLRLRAAVSSSYFLRRPSAMVVKTETCSFSGLRIYPGHGIMFVRGDSKGFKFINRKVRSLFTQRLNPRKLAWTVRSRPLLQQRWWCVALRSCAAGAASSVLGNADAAAVAAE